jgi:hypothetical protein
MARVKFSPDEDEEPDDWDAGPPDWRAYEEQIYRSLKEIAGDEATVEFDQSKPGRFSGVQRQVDVWVEGTFAGGIERNMSAAVDCKHFSRNLDVTAVEAFMSFVKDVGADLGIMVTTRGYSSAAKRRVEGEPFRLHEVPFIDIVEFDELDQWRFAWEPPDDEREPSVYVGDYYDHTPYGDYGASVQYSGDDGFGGLLAGRDVTWDDDEGRRVVIGAMMTHCLGREPAPDAIASFLHEYRDRLADGHPFEFERREVEHMAW